MPAKHRDQFSELEGKVKMLLEHNRVKLGDGDVLYLRAGPAALFTAKGVPFTAWLNEERTVILRTDFGWVADF